MIKKKRKKWKHQYRAPKNVNWNQFIVDWNNLHQVGGSIARAAQLFGTTRGALVSRRGTLARFGIYLPALEGMDGFKNRKWIKSAARVCKRAPQSKPAPLMLADMVSNANFRLVLEPIAG